MVKNKYFIEYYKIIIYDKNKSILTFFGILLCFVVIGTHDNLLAYAHPVVNDINIENIGCENRRQIYYFLFTINNMIDEENRLLDFPMTNNFPAM